MPGVDLFQRDDLRQVESLTRLLWHFRASRAFMAAHQLGVFEALREPGDLEKVVEKCGTDPAMTEKLLTVCCALGVVRRNGAGFGLTTLGREVLLADSPWHLGGAIDHCESLWWYWTGLPDVVRTGRHGAAPAPPEPFESNWHNDFIRAMHSFSVNGPAQWLARQVDLNGKSHLLDVGGGPGTYSIALCQRFPGLRAVVWDLPETLEIARDVIQDLHMEDRVGLQEGDWDRDEFGSSYDCMLLSNVLHGPRSGAATKLGKAFRSLDSGATLVVHDFLLDNDREGPLEAALFYLMVGAYTVDEMRRAVLDAGFEEASLVARDMTRGSGIVVARRP